MVSMKFSGHATRLLNIIYLRVDFWCKQRVNNCRYLGRIVKDRLRVIYSLVRPAVVPDEKRYPYQRPHVKHNFSPGMRVLDIGSGGDPFPYATILADRYLNPTHHRSAKFQSSGQPVVICDVQALPFIDKAFDYVVASHILEHVEDPIKSCSELQRIGKAGFIEMPTLMKDSLFSWAKGMHKWHVVSIGKRLVFFEYSERQLAGIRSFAYQQLIFSTVYHPLQDAFNDNQDLFNVMLEWKDDFDVVVMKLDGSIQSLHTMIETDL